MTTLIPRNTTIPTRKSETFSTAADSQTSVEVHVLQGERPMARDNRTLGKFHLSGLPPAPRGVPQIEVTFDIDANGIVNVSAKDNATQKEQKIPITASSGLSKDEVDRMMREAESHADEDKKRKEEIETRNRADQAAYAAERFLKDSGDKLPAADKAPIESAIEELKKAIEKNDVAEMQSRMEALNTVQHKAAEALYRSASAAGGAVVRSGARRTAGRRAPAAADADAGDVIDAEVVEEEKKRGPGPNPDHRIASAMDFYVILGVGPDASAADIKRAYRRLSRRYHPGINPGDRAAQERVRADRRGVRGADRIRAAPGVRQPAACTPVAAAPGSAAAVPQFTEFDFSVRAHGAQASTFSELFADVLNPVPAAGEGRPEPGADLHAALDAAVRGAAHRRRAAGGGDPAGAVQRVPRGGPQGHGGRTLRPL